MTKENKHKRNEEEKIESFYLIECLKDVGMYHGNFVDDHSIKKGARAIALPIGWNNGLETMLLVNKKDKGFGRFVKHVSLLLDEYDSLLKNGEYENSTFKITLIDGDERAREEFLMDL
jgi:hypothetical protein